MQKMGSRILLLALAGLLLAPVAVHAELKANSAVYAWDVTAKSYQNSNVIVYWDGRWIPFIHNLGWDRDGFDTSPYGGCGITPYAGIMEFGLYHTDNAPAGALGFQDMANWKLVDCDRDGDDLAAQPPQGFVLYQDLNPLTQDQVVPCGTGNCHEEIVTTLYINLDTNCDGAIDAGVSTHVCFYAEARTPLEQEVTWEQILQARVQREPITTGSKQRISTGRPKCLAWSAPRRKAQGRAGETRTDPPGRILTSETSLPTAAGSGRTRKKARVN